MSLIRPVSITKTPRNTKEHTCYKNKQERTKRILSSIIKIISFFSFLSLSPKHKNPTKQNIFLLVGYLCEWLLVGHHCIGHRSTSSISSCEPSRANKEQRLQSSTTTTSSSSSYYLSAPSPPSMASRSGTGQRKKGDASALGHGSHADRTANRWYTVLALPFPDQRLGRRDINTFGQGGIYTSSRAGYFSNQDR